MTYPRAFTIFSISLIIILSACTNNDDDNDVNTQVTQPNEDKVPAFASSNELNATIRYTSYGVPHIKADSLEELAYATAYAQAQDSLCILADSFIKVNSERSKYFGPHKSISNAAGGVVEENNQNLVSDFAYKSLKLRELAEKKINNISENSLALIQGFASGYNQFIDDVSTGERTADPFCSGLAWVKPVTAVDVAANMLVTALLPGSANFLDVIFYANPGDDLEYMPRAVASASSSDLEFLKTISKSLLARSESTSIPKKNRSQLGSNGWGLGKEATENGKGMLLANPHFPFTGSLRFWQSHITIDGHLDAMGASLIGMVGPVNIGFNKNLAWTHTFSTAEHIIIYDLSLTDADRLSYEFDAEVLPISKETVQIQVNTGAGGLVTLEKDIYTTAKGPMIETPSDVGPLVWSDQQAFFIQDANTDNLDTLEHWLAINRASDLTEFQQAYKDYDGVIFNNTLYADDQGNAFYIDDSTVPGLSDFALNQLRSSSALQKARQQLGFTVLPGNTSLMAFDSASPYEKAPKLLRTDYVQNSNDSFWATNPAEPLVGYSPLYGREESQLSLRTRMGLRLLNDGGGEDNKFSLLELESALLTNRSYLGELVLPDIIEQCKAQGTSAVTVNAEIQVDISEACSALMESDGTQNKASKGAVLFREIVYLIDEGNYFTVPFDSENPASTPNTLLDDGSLLVLIARATLNVKAAGFSLDETLGAVQFMEVSDVGGNPTGHKIAWPGSDSLEGGFNVFSTRTESTDDGTLIPQHSYETVKDVVTGEPLKSGLSEEGYHIWAGSSWIMVVGFSDDGPQARGLLTYSQGSYASSENALDQSEIYGKQNQLRPLLFNEQDIASDVIRTIELSTSSAN